MFRPEQSRGRSTRIDTAEHAVFLPVGACGEVDGVGGTEARVVAGQQHPDARVHQRPEFSAGKRPGSGRRRRRHRVGTGTAIGPPVASSPQPRPDQQGDQCGISRSAGWCAVVSQWLRRPRSCAAACAPMSRAGARSPRSHVAAFGASDATSLAAALVARRRTADRDHLAAGVPDVGRCPAGGRGDHVVNGSVSDRCPFRAPPRTGADQVGGEQPS